MECQDVVKALWSALFANVVIICYLISFRVSRKTAALKVQNHDSSKEVQPKPEVDLSRGIKFQVGDTTTSGSYNNINIGLFGLLGDEG